MKLTQQKLGAVTLLRPEGPVVEAHAEELSRQLSALLSSTMGRTVLDLSLVPFIDSLGLEALLDVSDSLQHVGRCLKLCAVGKSVRQILELTGIDSNFDFYDDANSAVRSYL